MRDVKEMKIKDNNRIFIVADVIVYTSSERYVYYNGKEKLYFKRRRN